MCLYRQKENIYIYEYPNITLYSIPLAIYEVRRKKDEIFSTLTVKKREETILYTF